MTKNLLITRAENRSEAALDPINRHVWLNLAIATPALFLLKSPFAGERTDSDVDYPAFTLLGRYNRPTLFWRSGTVVVKDVTDDYLPELLTIARRLGARLLDRDGREIT